MSCILYKKRRKALTILTYVFNEMIPIFRLHSSPVDLLPKTHDFQNRENYIHYIALTHIL
jgi:hypothetical protein